MDIIFVLIPIAILFVTIAVIVFFWAVKSNQFDDLDREGQNILFDEELPLSGNKTDKKSKKENKNEQ